MKIRVLLSVKGGSLIGNRVCKKNKNVMTNHIFSQIVRKMRRLFCKKESHKDIDEKEREFGIQGIDMFY